MEAVLPASSVNGLVPAAVVPDLLNDSWGNQVTFVHDHSHGGAICGNKCSMRLMRGVDPDVEVPITKVEL